MGIYFYNVLHFHKYYFPYMLHVNVIIINSLYNKITNRWFVIIFNNFLLRQFRCFLQNKQHHSSATGQSYLYLHSFLITAHKIDEYGLFISHIWFIKGCYYIPLPVHRATYQTRPLIYPFPSAV